MKNKSKSAVKVYDKIAKKYTKLFFEEISDREFVDKFLELLPRKARILDSGCGPGKFVKYFLVKGYYVEGVDLSEEMIKIAKQKVPGGVFKMMDLRELRYPNESFDGLFANFSLIHVPEEEIAPTLQEFKRVLKPGGVLFISVYLGKGEKFVEEPLAKGEKTFTKFFTEEELKQDLEETNFSIIETVRKVREVKGALGSNKLIIIARKS